MTWSTEGQLKINTMYSTYQVRSRHFYTNYCIVVSFSHSIGLLVMVLVVLLIVCVGINTGSAQQGELTMELTPKCTQVLDKKYTRC